MWTTGVVSAAAHTGTGDVRVTVPRTAAALVCLANFSGTTALAVISAAPADLGNTDLTLLRAVLVSFTVRICRGTRGETEKDNCERESFIYARHDVVL